MSTLPCSPTSVNGDRPLRHIRTPPYSHSAAIHIGDREIRFDARTIADGEQVNAITEAFRSATDASFALDQILFAPEPFRSDALRFLADILRAFPTSRVLDRSAGRHQTLSDAAFACLCGHENPTECHHAIQLAVTAAAIEDPEAMPAWCSRIRVRLRELGVTGYRVTQLVRMGQQVIQAGFIATAAPMESDIVYVNDALEDSDTPEDLVVPKGWRVTREGISRLRSNVPEPVTSAPVFITKRLIDIAGMGEFWEIAWWRDDQRVLRTIARAEASDRRRVLQLAEFGAPVTSENAASLVQFLSDFEAANLDVLPVEQVARTMGWHGVGRQSVFLCGRTVIAAPSDCLRPASALEDGRSCVSEAHVLEVNHDEVIGLEPGGLRVTFRGQDVGDEQCVDAYHTCGDFSRWAAAIAALGAFPKARLAIYTSLSSPLLHMLRLPNGFLSYAGPTSSGKTTTIEGAASVWGNPDQRSDASAMTTWDATRVFIERNLTVLRHIPLCVDDTKRARRKEDVAQTVYDLASGRERGRGSVQGIRASGNWQTYLLTTGESSIFSFTEDGGMRARGVEIWGSPFGETSLQTAQLVTWFSQQIRENYGHAGPRFVAFLLVNQQLWPAWREHIESRRRVFQTRAGSNAVAGRLAVHFATIEFAAVLGHRVLGLPWEYDNAVEILWPDLVPRNGRR